MKKRDEQVRVGVEGLSLWEVGQHLTTGEKLTAMAPLARASDPETSHQAAASMVDHAGAQRQAILEYLLAHPEGATADELDDRLGWRPSTAGRRLGELLVAAHDYVVIRLDGGYDYAPLGALSLPAVTRKTRQGRQAFVHVHRDHLTRALDAGTGER